MYGNFDPTYYNLRIAFVLCIANQGNISYEKFSIMPSSMKVKPRLNNWKKGSNVRHVSCHLCKWCKYISLRSELRCDHSPYMGIIEDVS